MLDDIPVGDLSAPALALVGLCAVTLVVTGWVLVGHFRMWEAAPRSVGRAPSHVWIASAAGSAFLLAAAWHALGVFPTGVSVLHACSAVLLLTALAPVASHQRRELRRLRTPRSMRDAHHD